MSTKFQLASKFVLADKEEMALPFTAGTVELAWESGVDLDLCVFYRAKNGTEGGITFKHLTEELNDTKFLDLSGDAGVGATAGDNHEVATIHAIPAEVEVIEIVVLNFTDAKAGRNSHFGEYDGFVRVSDANGNPDNTFGVALADTTPNPVFHVATIDNSTGTPKLINRNTTMPLDGLFGIPGAAARLQ